MASQVMLADICLRLDDPSAEFFCPDAPDKDLADQIPSHINGRAAEEGVGELFQGDSAREAIGSYAASQFWIFRPFTLAK